MSYSFNPLTEEEINAFSLMDDGVYEFEVLKSTRQISKSNNPMAKLELRVWDKEGREHFVFDYLVFSTIPLNIRKVKHFCEAVGLHEEYKQGQIPEELERYCGQASIMKQAEQEIPEDKLNGKPKGSKYPAKNFVADYIASPMKPSMLQPLTQKKNELDDDIPF
jgi:hypothetical protein